MSMNGILAPLVYYLACTCISLIISMPFSTARNRVMIRNTLKIYTEARLPYVKDWALVLGETLLFLSGYFTIIFIIKFIFSYH